MYKGIATFAAQRADFPVDDVMAAFPRKIKKPAIAILADFYTKRSRYEMEEQFCFTFEDRPHLIEYHMCFRSPYDPPHKMAQKAADIKARLINIITPNTKIIFCPILEDEMIGRSERWREYAKAIKTMTGCKIVRCSNTKPSFGGRYQERHGVVRDHDYQKPPYKRIYNPDGRGVDFDCPVDHYFKKISTHQFLEITKNVRPWAAFIWYAPLQGLGDYNGWHDKPPVNERNYVISDKAIKGMRKLLKKRWR